MYLPCNLSQEATGRCAPPKQGSIQKDESMGPRAQESQYWGAVQGGPLHGDGGRPQDTAVHSRPTSADLSKSEGCRETALGSLN